MSWPYHKYTLVKISNTVGQVSIVSIIGEKAQAAPYQASPMQVKASTFYQADFSDKCDSFAIQVTTCCLHRIIIKALSALLPPSSTMISDEKENSCCSGGEARADKPSLVLKYITGNMELENLLKLARKLKRKT